MSENRTKHHPKNTSAKEGGGNDISSLWLQVQKNPSVKSGWMELLRAYVKLSLVWQAHYVARQAKRLGADIRTVELLLSSPEFVALETKEDSVLGCPVLVDASLHVENLKQHLLTHEADWLSWLYLARLLEMRNSPADIESSQRALDLAQTLEPISGESLHWMGVWSLNAGNASAATQRFFPLVSQSPLRHGSMMYLGEALIRQGNYLAAEKAFARASLADNVDFLLLLAEKVYTYNYWNEAVEVLQKALGLAPNRVDIWLSLAIMQSEIYSLEECRQSLEKVFSIESENLQARLVHAGLQGRLGDARAHLKELQELHQEANEPLSRIASSIAMTALYNEQLSAEALFELHRQVVLPIEAATQAATQFDNDLAVGRIIRIGFVTGDLHRQHPVNIFMLPILKRLNKSRFEICVYHTGTMHDLYTEQAKNCADRWLEAAKLDDGELKKIIQQDRIDVLIDLAGQTSGHRLGVFAMRAAPVQATFLGYPHSTGLTQIDWLIGDATVSPVEHMHLFSEGVAQLPDSVFCWNTDEAYPLPKPGDMDAPLVLGSFNNAMKLSPRTIALWARVLDALPKSQLLLKAPSLKDKTVQERFIRLFSEQGIDSSRLILRGPSGLSAMMQEYGDMDIALDPTPYNGGTTSLQALWMGVPVVTLLGDNFVSRMGASFMRTLGKSSWVASSEDSYVDAVVNLAKDVGSLRTGRSELRSLMKNSPLCDIQTYVRNFENLLSRMWEHKIRGDTAKILSS